MIVSDGCITPLYIFWTWYADAMFEALYGFDALVDGFYSWDESFIV